MKCEELGISIGRADHLYLCFTPSLPEGTVRTTDYAVEPWHRFALYGMGVAFNSLSEERKLAAVATTDSILEKRHRLCSRISGTAH